MKDEIEELNDLTYDLWFYSQAARDSLKAGEIKRCKEWVELIQNRFLIPVGPTPKRAADAG